MISLLHPTGTGAYSAREASADSLFLNGRGIAILRRSRNKNKYLLQEEKSIMSLNIKQGYMIFTDLLARAQMQLLLHAGVAITLWQSASL